MADRADITPAPPREPISRGSFTPAQSSAQTFANRDVGGRGVNLNAQAEVAGNVDWARQPLGPPQATQYYPDTTVASGVATASTAPASIYSDVNPLAVVADVFGKYYGAGITESPNNPVIVGDTSQTSSSGNSNGKIIFILLALGIGGYIIYKKYKGN